MEIIQKTIAAVVWFIEATFSFTQALLVAVLGNLKGVLVVSLLWVGFYEGVIPFIKDVPFIGRTVHYIPAGIGYWLEGRVGRHNTACTG